MTHGEPVAMGVVDVVCNREVNNKNIEAAYCLHGSGIVKLS